MKIIGNMSLHTLCSMTWKDRGRVASYMVEEGDADDDEDNENGKKTNAASSDSR